MHIRKNILNKETIETLQKYYYIKSIEDNKNYLAIFKYLFVGEHKLSMQRIANLCYIDLKTLYLYKKKIIALAEKLKNVKQSTS